MRVAIPAAFDEDFLVWFRRQTERAWALYETKGLAAPQVRGRDRQRGTHWLGGLSDAEIDRVERRWSLRFPPDYRLFLRHLHTLDRPVAGTASAGGTWLVPAPVPPVYNQLADTAALQRAFDWPLEGLLFDVEHSDLWLPGWGPRPSSRRARAARLRNLVAVAPRLVPVCGHRYLLGEPCRAGNPVFSIYQADIIVYGGDLRRYLLVEFAYWLGIDRDQYWPEALQISFPIETIPFWGEVFASTSPRYMTNTNHG